MAWKHGSSLPATSLTHARYASSVANGPYGRYVQLTPSRSSESAANRSAAWRSTSRRSTRHVRPTIASVDGRGRGVQLGTGNPTGRDMRSEKRGVGEGGRARGGP